MRIAVLGAGGVGGFFGVKLARAGDEVVFIARGAHLEAMRQRGGLLVRSAGGEIFGEAAATDDPATVGPVDLVLFCVKSYDTEEAARLAPLLGEETAVLSLQNGVDNEDRIAAVVGAGRVLGGAAYIFATIEGPGVIRHSAGGSIAFGEMDGRITPRTERIRDVFAQAGIPADLTVDIVRVLWQKYLFICGVGGMTALTRLTIGEVRACAPSRQLLRQVVEEVAAVARARGISIPPDTVDRVMVQIDNSPPANTSSLHYDVTHGRRLEVEALHGTVVRLGREAGVPTPMNFAIYAALLPHDLRAAGERR